MERFIKILILTIVAGTFYLIGCSKQSQAYSTSVGGTQISYEVVSVRGTDVAVFRAPGGYISAVKL